MSFKILVINPGSTSTKIGVYEDETLLFDKTLRHSAEDIAQFNSIPAQKDWRCQLVLKALREENFDINTLSAVSGRGGLLRPIRGGTYAVNDNLVNDCTIGVQGQHASNLGGIIAREIGDSLGIPSYIVDPVVVDELADVARYAGHPLFQRVSIFHALNQKAVAKRFAKEHGKNYEDLNLIVCHVDGGITVTAHKAGRMVDSTEGAGGDGPFTPTRLGSIPVMEVLQYLDEGHTTTQMRSMLSRSGGFVSHFGTSDAAKVHALVEAGDKKAVTVWNAMIYQLCKSIGCMAAVLEGKVDGILLTGGLMRYDDILKGVEQRCGWIAPITVYPGECEQEAMADAVLEVLRGQRKANRYTGVPVFRGFDWDKK